MTTIIALVTLAVGFLIGAFLLYSRMAPQLEQLKKENQRLREEAQHFESMWTELVSLLDENGQLSEGVADTLLQRLGANTSKTRENAPALTRREGRSDDRRVAEIARIEAGQPSLDSLEGMRSDDCRMVLIARVKAKRPLQHTLEGMRSDDRRMVEVACAKAGIDL